MKTSPNCGLYVRYVPSLLLQEFAAKCLLEGNTQPEVLTKLIRDLVKGTNYAGLSTAGVVDRQQPCCALWINGKMPRQLVRAFAAWCKLRGKTQGEVIIAMMKEWVKE